MTQNYILQQILNSVAFKTEMPFLRFKANQLQGAIEVTEANRKKQLKRMRIETRAINMTKKTTEIYSAEHQFKCNSISKPKLVIYRKNDIGYSQGSYIDNEETFYEESLDLVFYVKHLDKVAGYFAFKLDFTTVADNNYFYILLEDLSISINHRDKEYWLDLTVSVIEFIKYLIQEICAQLRSPTDFEVKIETNLAGVSGSKVNYAVLYEIRRKLNSIILNNENMRDDNCFVYAYFEVDDAYAVNLFE